MERIVLTLIACLATASLVHAAVPVATDHVVLNEVLYDPSGDEAGNESVELYNPTTSAVNVTGWTLADGDRCLWDGTWTRDYALVLNGTIPPLGHLAVTIPSTGPYWRCLSLANGGDSITLRDATGAEVDAVSWPGDAPDDVGDGVSVQRCHVLAPGLTLATTAAWTADAPTLGAPNAPCT